ncbi:developmentally-regulated protein kinase 1-like [Liolophura sinensis]|uniref:developmentally-regulated protein kinase 1-like n=1 Tax=Liolophura sinensis TaxID=3198878 RepID=UPI0031598145
MSRRFKRFKRLRQQVVEVTRRIWKTCVCCGGIREETRKDIVPLTAVISGTAAMWSRPIRVDNPVGTCCHPLKHDCWLMGQKGHQEDVRCSERNIGSAESEFVYVSQGNFGKPNCSPRQQKTGSGESTVNGEKPGSSDGSSSTDNQSPVEDSSSQETVSPPLSMRSCPVPLYKQPGDLVHQLPMRNCYTPIEVSNGLKYAQNINVTNPLPNSGIVSSVVLSAIEEIDCDADLIVIPSMNPPNKLNQKPDLTLNLSEIISPRADSPPQFRLEFARDEFWYRLRPYDWKIQRNISRNHRSEVDIITLQHRQEAFALKTLNYETSLTEAVHLMDCQSPFVVKMCASFVLGDERYICMDYYKNKDLAHWMRKDCPRKYFSEKEAIWICAYILASLDFLHSKSILHLDVKPGNILIDDKGYPVLGDFGSAVSLANLKNFTRCQKITPAYACPEVQSPFPPVKLWDLWPVACIFYEIITTKSPWQGKSRAETELRASLVLTPDVSMLSPTAQNFVTSQLRPTVTERLGFSAGAREIMRHKIFREVDWDRVKYGHRHDDSHLLDILHKLGSEEVLPTNVAELTRQASASSSCQNNNSWELWASSSSDEDSNEEFHFSACVKREIFTVIEEDEDEETNNRLESQDHNSNNSRVS